MLPFVVDEHDVATGAVEQAGGDAGPEARGAMHPQPVRRDLVEAVEHAVQRDVGRPSDGAAGPFIVAADVEDGGVVFGGQVAERPAWVAADLGPAGEVGEAGGEMFGGIGGAVPQVDDPLPGCDALGDLVRVDRRRQGQVRRRRAGCVAAAHVDVGRRGRR